MSDETSEVKTSDLKKVNILIVDDQPIGLVALEAVLNSPEYNLVMARSGHEALKCLLEYDFALILLDVRMPELDGFETAEIIKTREKSKDIPIIFITGADDDTRYVYKGYKAGAVDYLFKPFDASILRSKVSIFIELFRKNSTIEKQAKLISQSEIARHELASLKRYRILADAIPHMVWEAKPDGTIQYLNKCWCDYTQMNSEQSVDKGWQALFEPADLALFLSTWEAFNLTGNSFETECRIKRGKDSIYRWHLLRMVPEKNPEGQVCVWLGTGTDIHERKQVEDEMRKASQAACEATKIKSDFLAAMSHEIRTPMNAVLGMTRLLLESKQSKEQKSYTEIIRCSGETLLGLINDILDFSKIEAGKMELELIDFNLEQLLRDCENSFSVLLKEKGLKFVTKLEPEMPLGFKGDPGRLQQILLNMVNNAIKFTSKGSISIHVGKIPMENKEDKDLRLKFEIQDSGIGIPEADLTRIFESFSQADTSTTRRFGGTGLGLSICKQLVELMGGKISVASVVGKGSTFSFELPLQISNQVFQKRKVQIPSVYRINGGKVLVAEDNSANQIVARRLLEKMGYRVEVVGNGHEVLAALKKVPYDLILMDWRMPEMDGCEATRIIRNSNTASYSKIPIIAMTANAIKGDHEICMDAGMNDYISKPIDFDLLANKLEKWIPAPKSISQSVDRNELKIFDPKALDKLKSLDDDGAQQKSVLTQFLTSFFKTAPVRISKIKEAAQGNDSSTLFLEVHSLKTNCAYVGAMRMLHICLQLEELSEQSPLPNVVPLVSSLETEYNTAKQAIELAHQELFQNSA